MAKLLKLRRGTTSQHSSFTGAEGEVTIDTNKDVPVVHDGSTAGGHPVAAEDMSNVSSASITGRLGTGSIATAKIADLNVTAAKLAVNSVTTAKIADNAVDSTKIAQNSILTKHIDDNQIGIAQLNVSDGTSGQALVTDGSGTLSFDTAGISTGKAIAMAIVFG